MLRISGVNIPEQKRATVGLSYIYGVGRKNAKTVLQQANISGDPKLTELSATQIDTVRSVIESNFTVEADLRQIVNQNIRRLKEIGSYRGSRHTRGLPVRGQRTRTNARIKRGKRMTMGSGRHKAPTKT